MSRTAIPTVPNNKPKKSNTRVIPSAVVREETRERLIQEAMLSPAYEGMAEAEVAAFVNAKLDGIEASLPWWFGNLECDTPKKPVSEASLKSIAHARQQKAELQAEAKAPYRREEDAA